MFSRVATSILYSGIRYSGLGKLYNRVLGRKSGVLAYHNVLPDDAITDSIVNAVDVSVSAFRRHLEYLERRDLLLSVDRLHDDVKEGFFLTFDDGMRNNVEIVAPILREFGVRALFSVCPGLITGEIPYVWKDHFYLILSRLVGTKVRMPWGKDEMVTPESIDRSVARFHAWVVENKRADVYDLIGELGDRYGLGGQRLEDEPLRFRGMTESMIRQLASDRHVIASHTWSHRILSTLSDEEKARELETSKEFLERTLGQEVRHVVYPYGGPAEVGADTMRLAHEKDYKWGFVNVPYQLRGPAGMNVPRFSLPNTTSVAEIEANLFGFRHALKYVLGNAAHPVSENGKAR